MMRVSLLLVVATTVMVSAQSPTIPMSTDLAFDVASVKPNKSGSTSSSTSGTASMFVATNVTTRLLITFGYRIRAFQLQGGPRWLDSDRFDITARAPENVARDNPARVRALLKERFNFRAHTETKEDQIFALVIASRDRRLGPQMKPSVLDCSPQTPSRGPNPCGLNTTTNDAVGRIVGSGQTAENLANALGNFGLSRMVVDRTGLKGPFDFELRWTPDASRGVPGNTQADDAPSLFAALSEQLGLRLESQRGPVEFLVIDSIGPPTPD